MSTGTWVFILEYKYEYSNSIVVEYYLCVWVLEYEYEYYNSIVVEYFFMSISTSTIMNTSTI